MNGVVIPLVGGVDAVRFVSAVPPNAVESVLIQQNSRRHLGFDADGCNELSNSA